MVIPGRVLAPLLLLAARFTAPARAFSFSASAARSTGAALARSPDRCGLLQLQMARSRPHVEREAVVRPIPVPPSAYPSSYINGLGSSAPWWAGGGRVRRPWQATVALRGGRGAGSGSRGGVGCEKIVGK